MPATLFIAAVNLLPILGVLFWGWDAFELLVLYWCETAIIAFWAVLRVGIASKGSADARPSPFARRLVRALFLTLTIAVFMCVHMAVLWNLFSGAWAERVHGPVEFVRELLIGNGVWLPLAVTFVMRGVLTLLDIAGPAAAVGRPLRELFGRIVVLQVLLILGGWLVMAAGKSMALVLLVAARTLIEFFVDRGVEKRRAASA